MATKLCLFVGVALVVLACLQYSTAAPRPTNQELLEKSIADYLRHDKELVKELRQLGFEANSPSDRVKRQSEVEIDTNDYGAEEEPKQPGFFDRAAKFVMEILQRFLKWINTEDS